MDDELKKIALDVWTYLDSNKEWLFSGIGASVLLVVVGFLLTKLGSIFWFSSKKIGKAKENLQEAEERLKQQTVVLKPDHVDRLKYDPEYRRLHEKVLQEQDNPKLFDEHIAYFKLPPWVVLGGRIISWGFVLLLITLLTALLTSIF